LWKLLGNRVKTPDVLWPAVKGYYRFIDKPEDSAVTMENILQPHRTQTIRRMQDQKIVLCPQDGSDLNYNNLDRCKDLGVIGIRPGLKVEDYICIPCSR